LRDRNFWLWTSTGLSIHKSFTDGKKNANDIAYSYQISNTLSGRLYNMQLILDNYYNKSITIERPFIRQLPNGQVELSWTAI
jgi:hypothetical protein